MNQNRDETLYVIDGVVPLPVQLPPSCGFHERCEYCEKGKCDRQDVREYTVEPGHMVRCLRMEKEG